MSEFPPRSDWRQRTYEIIFEADTSAGRLFDVLLIIAIIASVLVVMLESVAGIRADYGPALLAAEWMFTILFTIEYALRLATVHQPLRYARSFFGIIDLLAVLPTYLGLIFTGAQALIVIRAVRILRIFRVLKLSRYLGEASELAAALRAGRHKIAVFIIGIATIVPLVGAIMYLVEGPENGFNSIPRAAYWTIVTMTTVGYGDIAPQTVLGQCIASFVMILGYGIIAVPTGIVTAELTRPLRERMTNRACRHCSAEGHSPDAKFCKHCGEPLGESNE